MTKSLIKHGVSIVICCHNSAQMLPETLRHLSSQHVRDDILWEVIIVDNSSTDNTSEIALNCWPKNPPAPLKVVHEDQLGLIYARIHGFNKASFEFVSFIDDDNWVCPKWVQLVYDTMLQHPDIGACGGHNEPVFESTPPWWIDKYGISYAIGEQGDEAGDITWSRGFLWGAGITIRQSSWENLIKSGFCPLLVGHQGEVLTRGEDAELCYALRLSGWRLWYNPSLRLKHYLPAHRLRWNHLRSMRRGGGGATVLHDPYHFAVSTSNSALLKKLIQTWQWQSCAVLLQLIIEPIKLFRYFIYQIEGSSDELLIEKRIGRLLELIKRRKEYNTLVREICKAPWRS